MIIVNGKIFEKMDNTMLSEFLNKEGYDIARIAVECGGSIVPKAEYINKRLYDGDVLEVVSFVGGG